MIKKIALLATMAALFVACSSGENTEAMEMSNSDASAQELIDAANADAEVVVAPETATEEVLIEETGVPVEGAEVGEEGGPEGDL